ncbi:MAG: hypothetical protein ABSD63_15620 [Candidatus Korobacteraceae bacterium]|jgi:hypothetical protein
MSDSFERYDWERLNHLQIGKYAEYLAKMEFVLCGCEVFTSEVDDRGIDFVIRSRQGTDTESGLPSVHYYDVQVKSFRSKKSQTPYIFLPQDKFEISPTSLLVLVQFERAKPPILYLLPSSVQGKPNPLFEDRKYGEGKKSPPEWGLTVSKKKLELLIKDCCFQEAVTRLGIRTNKVV